MLLSGGCCGLISAISRFSHRSQARVNPESVRWRNFSFVGALVDFVLHWNVFHFHYLPCDSINCLKVSAESRVYNLHVKDNSLKE